MIFTRTFDFARSAVGWCQLIADVGQHYPYSAEPPRLTVHRCGNWIMFDDGEEFWAVPVQSVTMVNRSPPCDSVIIAALIPGGGGELMMSTRGFKSDDVAVDLRRIVDMLGSGPAAKRGNNG